jgi:hypothetical protein
LAVSSGTAVDWRFKSNTAASLPVCVQRMMRHS